MGLKKELKKEKEKAHAKKGWWKKLAEGQQLSNKEEMDMTKSMVGTKWRLLGEENKEDDGKKRLCGGDSLSFDSMGMATRQHSWEPWIL